MDLVCFAARMHYAAFETPAAPDLAAARLLVVQVLETDATSALTRVQEEVLVRQVVDAVLAVGVFFLTANRRIEARNDASDLFQHTVFVLPPKGNHGASLKEISLPLLLPLALLLREDILLHGLGLGNIFAQGAI